MCSALAIAEMIIFIIRSHQYNNCDVKLFSSNSKVHEDRDHVAPSPRSTQEGYAE